MLSWSYADALFEAKTIERMAASYRVLLDAIVADATTAVDRLPLLTDADHQQLARWNETAMPYPADQCVHQLFEAQAAKDAGRARGQRRATTGSPIAS